MYNNYPVSYGNPDDERFLFAPFLLGGLAGTALGYGIANNNQNPTYYPVYPMYPPYPYPTCPNCPTNNYYF